MSDEHEQGCVCNKCTTGAYEIDRTPPSELAAPAGYAVFGTRSNPVNGQPEVFRTPERGSYPEDIADRMVEEMRFLHPRWHWGKMKA